MKLKFLLSLFFLTAFIWSDQIIKVAVVDYNQILSIYYRESQYVRQITEFEDDIKQEISDMDQEIKDLQSQLLDARRNGDEHLVLDLEDKVESKKDLLVDFIQVKRSQLEEMKNRMESELSVVDEIIDAMKYVAENNGYSMVFRKDDPSILWYSFDVDITQEVINYLMSS
ncbi:MAG: OmpH family outer membrane protein [Spirochaetaceae bacterium]|jgi:outer membrane protein|nr:OmpH family outer membrane protein [Spirochaetaceae bacterium]